MAAWTGRESDLLGLLEGDRLGAMLYGSCARGDASNDSDIDVLQVVSQARPHYNVGAVSVTLYTPEELKTMCQSGSLFALHLVREARVLEDPSGVVRATLSTYRPPADYSRVWLAIRSAARCLDAADSEVLANPEGFARLAMYLVRTAAILRNLEQTAIPCFAIGGLAQNLSVPAMLELFAQRERPELLDGNRVALGRLVLEELLGHRIHNPYGSLAAFAVSTELEEPVTSRLAISLLAGDRHIVYGDQLFDLTLPGRD